MKQLGKENNARAKGRFDRDAGEIQRLKTVNAELETQMESLSKELEEVKARSQEAAASGAPVDPGLAQELEALRTEKASLEQALAQEQAAHLLSSAQVSEQAVTLVSNASLITRQLILMTVCRTSFVQSATRSSRRRRSGRPLERRPPQVPQIRLNGTLNALS